MSKIIVRTSKTISTPATTPFGHRFSGTVKEVKEKFNTFFEEFLSPQRAITEAAKRYAAMIHFSEKEKYDDNGVGYGGNSYIIKLNSYAEANAVFTIPAFYINELSPFLTGQIIMMGFQRCLDASGKLAQAYLNQLIRIVEHFDTNLVNDVVVWYDEKRGQFLVIDGGHTLLVLLFLNFSSIKVKEIYAKTLEEAINIYNSQQRYSTSLNGIQLAIGQAAAGNKDMQNILRLLLNHNINISGYETTANAKFRSFDTVVEFYNNHGYVGLNRILNILIGVWGIEDKKLFVKEMILMFNKIYTLIYGTNCQKELLALVNDMKSYESADAWMNHIKATMSNRDCSIVGHNRTKEIENQMVAYAQVVMGVSSMDNFPLIK